MTHSIRIKPLNPIAAVVDLIFSCVAAPLSIPLTHPWNRVRLSHEQREWLQDDRSLTVVISGDPNALEGNHPIRSHVRFLGGWKKYVVLEAPVPWHVGWIIPDGKGGKICEVSRLVIRHRVKMLIGPYETGFIAIAAESGKQTRPSAIGYGRLGEGDLHRNITLL
ncbi:MAG: hypothetical protein HGA38_04825 [Candidatus Moranbacteria bacterium]|nr:hypothetical protein [Candidatus Moranbacteria bacterium]